jgi:hypothetical protein
LKSLSVWVADVIYEVSPESSPNSLDLRKQIGLEELRSHHLTSETNGLWLLMGMLPYQDAHKRVNVVGRVEGLLQGPSSSLCYLRAKLGLQIHKSWHQNQKRGPCEQKTCILGGEMLCPLPSMNIPWGTQLTLPGKV